MTKIEVFSDGSGNTFESDGGYGWRILVDGCIHEHGSGYLSSATNNVAELTGGIEGLTAAKELIASRGLQPEDVEVTLVADSQLVLGYASGRYRCNAIHLSVLYIKIRQLYQELNCKQRWVKGHNGDEHNEFCDRLAKAAREGKGAIARGEEEV